jgi:hypothetical protein
MTDDVKLDEAGLLPCPFCRAELVVTSDHGGDPLYTHPDSEHCVLSGSAWNYDCFDIAAWNRRATPSSKVKADDDEAYEIGKRDGYEEAVQDIDVLTGGDGEYRFCTDGDPERHTPDPATMKQRIVDRFSAAHPPEAAPVAVKALEWKHMSGRGGGYLYTVKEPKMTRGWRVWVQADSPMMAIGGVVITMTAATYEDAKAIAQADYESRIRSALLPAPSQEGASGDQRGPADCCTSGRCRRRGSEGHSQVSAAELCNFQGRGRGWRGREGGDSLCRRSRAS